jgi:hypothetical protein
LGLLAHTPGVGRVSGWRDPDSLWALWPIPLALAFVVAAFWRDWWLRARKLAIEPPPLEYVRRVALPWLKRMIGKDVGRVLSFSLLTLLCAHLTGYARWAMILWPCLCALSIGLLLFVRGDADADEVSSGGARDFGG